MDNLRGVGGSEGFQPKPLESTVESTSIETLDKTNSHTPTGLGKAAFRQRQQFVQQKLLKIRVLDPAATKIQSLVKGYQARKKLKAEKNNAATTIQKHFRGQKGRKKAKELKTEKSRISDLGEKLSYTKHQTSHISFVRFCKFCKLSVDEAPRFFKEFNASSAFSSGIELFTAFKTRAIFKENRALRKERRHIESTGSQDLKNIIDKKIKVNQIKIKTECLKLSLATSLLGMFIRKAMEKIPETFEKGIEFFRAAPPLEVATFTLESVAVGVASCYSAWKFKKAREEIKEAKKEFSAIRDDKIKPKNDKEKQLIDFFKKETQFRLWTRKVKIAIHSTSFLSSCVSIAAIALKVTGGAAAFASLASPIGVATVFGVSLIAYGIAHRKKRGYIKQQKELEKSGDKLASIDKAGAKDILFDMIKADKNNPISQKIIKDIFKTDVESFFKDSGKFWDLTFPTQKSLGETLKVVKQEEKADNKRLESARKVAEDEGSLEEVIPLMST